VQVYGVLTAVINLDDWTFSMSPAFGVPIPLYYFFGGNVPAPTSEEFLLAFVFA
jgi:hypothetical protein